MSATNRGAERRASDFYPTPWKGILPLMPFLSRDVNYWEPACGDGAIVVPMRCNGFSIMGADLAPKNFCEVTADF